MDQILLYMSMPGMGVTRHHLLEGSQLHPKGLSSPAGWSVHTTLSSWCPSWWTPPSLIAIIHIWQTGWGFILPLQGLLRDAQQHWRFLVCLKEIVAAQPFRRVGSITRAEDWSCISYLQTICWLAQGKGWKRSEQQPACPICSDLMEHQKAISVKDSMSGGNSDLFRAWHRRYPLQYYHLTFDYYNFPMHACTACTASRCSICWNHLADINKHK